MRRLSNCALGLLCLVLLNVSCKDKQHPPAPHPATATDQTRVLLEGTFQRVAKVVSGKVRIEQHGDKYELVVNPVSIPDLGPVHVYLVGLNQVRSSADLDAVDAKYDFGPLEQTGSNEYVAEQRITLPSKPAADLRSVALINPRFGVVLGASALHEPKP